MTHFLFAFNALMPLLLLASIGYLMKNTGLVSRSFIDNLNKYVFYIALPVLIFMTLSGIGNLEDLDWPVVYFAVGMLILVTLIGYWTVRFLRTERRFKPVIMQVFFRGNFTLIGIPLAIRLGGEETLQMIIILNAVLIPITNFLSILTFKIWKEESDETSLFTDVIKDTLRNPLMIGVFAGLLAYAVGATTDRFENTFTIIPETLSMIASTATPMALIAIGGQFEASQARLQRFPLSVAVVSRLVAVPLITFTVAFFLHRIIPFGDSWAALIAIFASPVAVSSGAITKGLGGDERFASQVVIFSTGLAVFSIFIIVIIFRLLGLL